MRQARIAISLLAVVAIAGCQNRPDPVSDVPEPAPYDSGYVPAEPVAVDPVDASALNTYDPAITTPSVAPAQNTYTIQKGDTLWAIATQVYGDGQRWVDIVQANPSLDPATMRVGQEIVLP